MGMYLTPFTTLSSAVARGFVQGVSQGVACLSYVCSRFSKFMKLVNGYRDHGHPLYRSLYYASRLVYKRRMLDQYAASSSLKEKNYLFTKVVVGGTMQLVLTRVKQGPKPILEYAYFDGVRKDHFFNLISGPNRDFGGNTEVLFLFAKEIRYKYLSQPEICIRSEIGEIDRTHQIHQVNELEKKILSMTLSYD